MKSPVAASICAPPGAWGARRADPGRTRPLGAYAGLANARLACLARVLATKGPAAEPLVQGQSGKGAGKCDPDPNYRCTLRRCTLRIEVAFQFPFNAASPSWVAHCTAEVRRTSSAESRCRRRPNTKMRRMDELPQ